MLDLFADLWATSVVVAADAVFAAVEAVFTAWDTLRGRRG
jgi:hypothetical protein